MTTSPQPTAIARHCRLTVPHPHALPPICHDSALGKVRIAETRQKPANRQETAGMKTHICMVCGVEFPHKHGGSANKCCSRACGFRYLAINAALRVQSKPAKASKPEPQNVKTATIRVCPVCGFAFIRPYGSIGSYKFCGLECLKKSKKERRRRLRRALRAERGSDSTHRKRAKKFGCVIEPVHRIRIFDRLGWRCCECGRPTPRDAMGLQLDESPELDHIIPLSKGGPHAEHNVQLLCRACNLAKGASIKEEKHAA